MTYIVVAVVVVVLVVGGGGLLLLNNGGSDNQATPTPTPPPSVGSATSLEFTVQDATGSYTYYADNLDTDVMLRLDILGETSYTYIINTADMTAFSNTTGTLVAEDYQTNLNAWLPVFQGYVAKLESWSGTGDHTYTESGATVTITNITVNPTFDDSVFATS